MSKFLDPPTFNTFLDYKTPCLTVSPSKTIHTSFLSNALDADLPTKVTFSARPGTVSQKGLDINPLGKAALQVRLLDLGTREPRQRGFLKFKASVRTDGRRDHGFEIDRRVAVFGLPNTTLYGNVAYRTSNKSKEWTTTSSFGVHQDFRISNLKFSMRAGMTPEGGFVYDLIL